MSTFTTTADMSFTTTLTGIPARSSNEPDESTAWAQRARRLDEPIEIALPYIAKTQDEKMYRVVRDRERWFQVVMGADTNWTRPRSTTSGARRAPRGGREDSLAFAFEVGARP